MCVIGNLISVVGESGTAATSTESECGIEGLSEEDKAECEEGEEQERQQNEEELKKVGEEISHKYWKVEGIIFKWLGWNNHDISTAWCQSIVLASKEQRYI